MELLDVQPPLQTLNVNWRNSSNLLGVNRAERLPQLAEIAKHPRWLPLATPTKKIGLSTSRN